MSNHIKVAKIGNTMARFEKTIKYINRRIDERSQSGKNNEENDVAYSHYAGSNDQGICWSF